MADCRACCKDGSHDRVSRQLGVGDYVGHVARSAMLAHCHLSTVVHTTARKLPDHAHDWPFLSTLLRGSYRSRTRTREMEFRRGVAVYHPRDFQHCDEIGCDGGLFFAVQLNPTFLQDIDCARLENGRDVAILDDDEAYVVLGALYAALCTEADDLVLESLAAELASHLLAPNASGHGGMPIWLERTEHRLREEPHVSLHELSRDAGVHVTTLTRLFRRHKNCSIGEFHARARARRAFFAVVGSEAPFSDVCQDAGYADQSHMTRDFRRAFAATPGQLRRSSGVYV